MGRQLIRIVQALAAAFRRALRPLVAVFTAFAVVVGLVGYGWLRTDAAAWRGEGSSVPDLPARRRDRACCAFGVDHRVEIGPFPVPFLRAGGTLRFGSVPVPLGPDACDLAAWKIPCLRLGGVANIGDLGPHRYDAARGAIDGRGEAGGGWGERNALFYTCRGGFIDAARVRDGADLTAYLISQFAQKLDRGGEIALTDYGAGLQIACSRMPSEALDRLGRDEVIVRLAAWSSHQVAIWHEIAQWYGASMPGFYPDWASAFSPEEIHSHAVGIRMLAGPFDWREHLESERGYDRWIGRALPRQLGGSENGLRAVPRALAGDLIRALDGSWWDSTHYLPDARAVTKRLVDVSSAIHPWAFPRTLVSDDPELLSRLDAHCNGEPIRSVCIEERIGRGSCEEGERDGIEIRSLVKLTVTIRENDWLARMQRESGRAGPLEAFRVGTTFDQERFPALAGAVLEEMKAMLRDPNVGVPDVPRPPGCCMCECAGDPTSGYSPRRRGCECNASAAAAP